jgi:NhaP-type Na+/H+ or K+/H+ antiporter
VLGISIMLLRRLPIVMMLQRVVPDLKTHRQAVFSGHFGPIGSSPLPVCRGNQTDTNSHSLLPYHRRGGNLRQQRSDL